MKGASSELRDQIVANLSQRVHNVILEELAFLKDVNVVDVFVAQVLQLVQRGFISLSSP